VAISLALVILFGLVMAFHFRRARQKLTAAGKTAPPGPRTALAIVVGIVAGVAIATLLFATGVDPLLASLGLFTVVVSVRLVLARRR
jgi:ABC-type uncharacterized transport system permease subunit